MPKTLLPWLLEIFPEVDGPYSMRVILRRLKAHHTPTISKSATYRALKSLQRSKITAQDVVPQEIDGRTARYGALAARRIAQRVTHDQPPTIVKKPSESETGLSSKRF